VEAITREEKIISGENLTPITRKEMFLAKASGQNIETPTPITREEIFLSKITGGGGSGFVVCDDWQAFSNNTIDDIEELKISYPNATVVEDNAFSGCEKLVAIDLPKVTSIGSLAFYGCTSLETLILRTTETVCVIDLTAFDNSGFLQNLQGTNNGYIYVPAVMYEYYRVGYEQPLASVLGEGAFDRIVRKIEDYPEICNGGSVSSGASAYTVSSVDELPTNAKEGSLAIVNETVIIDGAGTWVFHDELPNLAESFVAWANNDHISPFEISFSNNGINYLSFVVGTAGSSSWGIYTLGFLEDNHSKSVYTHNPEGSYGISHGWIDEISKTIDVSYTDNEAKKWLEAHATQTVKNEVYDVKTYLYVRQNGVWVYMGEVA
jgi:hypothetical protein